MSVESDGIGESFDEQMRMGTMAAMQVGQRMAQARAERMRRTQEESQQSSPASVAVACLHGITIRRVEP